MLRFLKNLVNQLLNKNWVVIYSTSGFWTKTDGFGSIIHELLIYNIEYNVKINRYRIKTQGKNTHHHTLYSTVLELLAAYNIGDKNEIIRIKRLDDFQDKIVVLTMPLSADVKDVWKYCQNDPELIREKDKLKKNLLNSGVEIYDEKDNILITSKGYMGTFWFSYIQNLPMSDRPRGKGENKEEDNED